MRTRTICLLAGLLVALIGLSGCEKKTTNAVPPEGLSLQATIGVNGHLDKMGNWTAPYIVTVGADTIGEYWTMPEAISMTEKASGRLAKGRPPVLNDPPPQSWNFLLTYIGPGEILTAPMPDPSPVPADSLYWLSVYQDSTGYVWVAVSPLPVNMGPPK